MRQGVLNAVRFSPDNANVKDNIKHQQRFFFLQEPTDSLEETLLLPQSDFSIATENANEDRDNPGGVNTDNTSNYSPDDARMCQFCTNLRYMCLICLIFV